VAHTSKGICFPEKQTLLWNLRDRGGKLKGVNGGERKGMESALCTGGGVRDRSVKVSVVRPHFRCNYLQN